jgi:hypothetical protein
MSKADTRLLFHKSANQHYGFGPRITCANGLGRCDIRPYKCESRQSVGLLGIFVDGATIVRTCAVNWNAKV